MIGQARQINFDHGIIPGFHRGNSGLNFYRDLRPAKVAKGYALLDLMISVMILGILGMAAVSVVGTWAGEQQLSRACQVLVSGIDHARFLAKRYQRPFKLTLSTADNSFAVVDTAPYPSAVPPQQLNNTPPVNADGVVLHPLTNSWYTVDFDTLPGLENVTLVSGPVKLTFDGGGNVRIAEVDYVLAAGSWTRTLRVSGISGRVFIP
nr:hypothetical protein [uncultured Desulfobacter sp.]